MPPFSPEPYSAIDFRTALRERQNRHIGLAAAHLAAAESGESPASCDPRVIRKWKELLSDLFAEETQ